MISLFYNLSYIATYVSILIYVIICWGMIKKREFTYHTEAYQNCIQQAKTCRKASILFCVFAWFFGSCMPYMECREIYQQISKNCYGLGCVWVIFAFASILVSVYLATKKRTKEEINRIGQIRNSGFLMYVLFMICSFLLNVS